VTNDVKSVVAAFFSHSTYELEPLGNGLINQTFRLTIADKRYVLQRLHKVLRPELMDDVAAITSHLSRNGWEVSQLVPTSSGQPYYADPDGQLWRVMTYLGSDGVLPDVTTASLQAMGELLGRWHQAMASCSHRLRFQLEHFHDTAYFAQRLASLQNSLPSGTVATLAKQLLDAYANLPHISGEKQLLHGDPQLSNALFRSGTPFTYIDLDTLMFGKPQLDVGDLIRSALEQHPADSKQLLEATVRGYNASPSSMSLEAAQLGTQCIALELGIRFVLDIIDDSYFSWDEQQFASRSENHICRATQQWNIYESLV
jgi:Ser/Thr protein kinase RdoA (MazF antagonist)